MKPKSYPHITRKRTILGGIPIVAGTRTPIRSIARYYQLGMSVDEILQSLPHWGAAQVHAVLAYSFDHQKEVDHDLTRRDDVAHWKKQAERFAKQSA